MGFLELPTWPFSLSMAGQSARRGDLDLLQAASHPCPRRSRRRLTEAMPQDLRSAVSRFQPRCTLSLWSAFLSGLQRPGPALALGQNQPCPPHIPGAGRCVLSARLEPATTWALVSRFVARQPYARHFVSVFSSLSGRFGAIPRVGGGVDCALCQVLCRMLCAQ